MDNLLVVINYIRYPENGNKCSKWINIPFIRSLSFGGPMVVSNGNSDGLIIYDKEARAIL